MTVQSCWSSAPLPARNRRLTAAFLGSNQPVVTTPRPCSPARGALPCFNCTVFVTLGNILSELPLTHCYLPPPIFDVKCVTHVKSTKQSVRYVLEWMLILCLVGFAFLVWLVRLGMLEPTHPVVAVSCTQTHTPWHHSSTARAGCW